MTHSYLLGESLNYLIWSNQIFDYKFLPYCNFSNDIL